MKKVLLLLTIFFLISASSIFAFAQEDIGKIIQEQYEASDMDSIRSITDEIMSPEIRDIIPEFNIDKVTEDLTQGKIDFDANAVFRNIMNLFMKEVYLNIRIMLQLIVLTILCGLLTNLQSAFENESVSQVAFFTCYIILVGVMVRSFTYAIDLGREVIENMVIFMQSMVPTLITLLISTGNITSASIFQPALLFAVQIIGAAIKNFLIPVLFFVTALSMVNNISDKFHVSKLIQFLKQVGKWALGILLTGFVGVVTVQGLASSVIDGVGSKTAKFAVGNFIPVVGGILSDAVDTVISCSLILKNAVGIMGLIVIVLICAVPIIKIAALIAIYRITGAVIEPISDKRIVQCVTELGDSLILVFALVVSVAVIFLLSITIVVGAGNISAMFR